MGEYNTPVRKPGFYWVKLFEGKWTIAEYFIHFSGSIHWMPCGEGDSFTSDDVFMEIDETRIPDHEE